MQIEFVIKKIERNWTFQQNFCVLEKLRNYSKKKANKKHSEIHIKVK